MIRNSNDLGLGGDSRLIVIHGENRQEVLQHLLAWQEHVAAAGPSLDVTKVARQANAGLRPHHERVALVVSSPEDLSAKLHRAWQRLSDATCHELRDVTGIYFTDTPMSCLGKLAFLFPGEASQYPGMLRGLDTRFASVQQVLSDFRNGAEQFGRSAEELIDYLSAGPQATTTSHGAATHRSDDAAMWNSVLVANWAYCNLVCEIGIAPDAMAGHSVGEFSVLALSGVVESQEKLFQLAKSLDDLTSHATGESAAGLLAIGASAATVQSLLDELSAAKLSDRDTLYLAMDNCPHQSVVVGWPDAIAKLEQTLRDRKLIFEQLPLDRPYHTPWFEPHTQPMRKAMAQVPFAPPRLPIYSATTATLFPSEPDAIRDLAVAHWAAPVRFTQLIRQMFDDGIRVFVEAGPRGNLHAFVQDILRGKQFLSIAVNVTSRSPCTQLDHAIAQLVAHRYPVRNEVLEYGVAQSEARCSFASKSCDDVSADVNVPMRRRVMLQFQQVMGEFLDLQREVMGQYLLKRAVGDYAVATESPWGDAWDCNFVEMLEAPTSGCPPEVHVEERFHPLLGDVIEFQKGQRIVTRRILDIARDIYAHDHAVGGKDISEVDPQQHGLPVVPMTFTVETMAALARQLFPDKQVIRVEDIRLHRWLPYYEHDPTTSEAVAVVVTGDSRDARAPDDVRRVRVEVRDLGNREMSHEGAKLAAVGDVVLADNFPTPPTQEIKLDNPRPSRVTLKRLYHNLFHGPRFRGVESIACWGDRQSEGMIATLPRNELFQFDPDPQFELDPVVLDVAMHVMAGWHLEHEDQWGRLTLPFKLDSVEFFGPCPEVGTSYRVLTRITRETSRQFIHDVEVFGPDGHMHARYRGVRLWRFYLPVGEVNFHGPKNIYYLSELCEEARPASTPAADPNSGKSECVRLVPPADLAQPAILLAASKVILSASELANYVKLTISDQGKVEWLFARAAMKDAVRKLWERIYDRRMFAADVEIVLDAHGCWYSQPRERFLAMQFPRVAYAHHGGTFIAVASLEGLPGVAIDTDVDHKDMTALVRRAIDNAWGSRPGEVASPIAVQASHFADLRVATCLVPFPEPC